MGGGGLVWMGCLVLHLRLWFRGMYMVVLRKSKCSHENNHILNLLVNSSLGASMSSEETRDNVNCSEEVAN